MKYQLLVGFVARLSQLGPPPVSHWSLLPRIAAGSKFTPDPRMVVKGSNNSSPRCVVALQAFSVIVLRVIKMGLAGGILERATERVLDWSPGRGSRKLNSSDKELQRLRAKVHPYQLRWCAAAWCLDCDRRAGMLSGREMTTTSAKREKKSSV